MTWVLWVPSEELAAELARSVDALWPAAPVELRVGSADEAALTWDGAVLRWEAHAEPVASPEAVVVLVRGWLREEDRSLGWVPAPPLEAPAPPPPVDAPPAGPTVRAYVGVGLGEQLAVAGVPDAMRLEGGVRLARGSVGLGVWVPVPRTRIPRRVQAEATPGDEVSYPVSGLGAAAHLAWAPWTGLRAGEGWTLAPVGLLGVGVRQSAWQIYRWRELHPGAAETALDLGPELGLGALLAGEALALRIAAVHRSGILDGYDHHLALAVDALIRM